MRRAYSNLRQGSMTETGSSGADRGYSSGTSAGSINPGQQQQQGLTRPTSETNLRQLAYGEGSSLVSARPGSALGLLQGSSIVNTNGMRTTAHLTSTALGANGTSVMTNRTNSLMTGFGPTTTTASFNQTKSEDQALRESLAAILPPDLRHLVGAPATTNASTTSDTNTILNAVRHFLFLTLKKITNFFIKCAI